ncbi:hypothetical protein PR048_017679 [Dryococelus australis]|uniref:Uncharacterized protein n=1 Tax=Dryococelus australis TaxID=614101 RepID=A0ABQ9HA58_9NEOP|nr:hypothetical protein PR048_017679 [Dryococelus australis]
MKSKKRNRCTNYKAEGKEHDHRLDWRICPTYQKHLRWIQGLGGNVIVMGETPMAGTRVRNSSERVMAIDKVFNAHHTTVSMKKGNEEVYLAYSYLQFLDSPEEHLTQWELILDKLRGLDH